MTNALQVSFAGTTKSRKSRNFQLLGCVVDGIEYQDGSQWREGCSECQCLNGVTSCQALSCSNCSIMTDNKEARNCCPQCLSGNDSEPPRKCQLLQGLEAKIQEYHNGQKWLSQCQECECLVGKKLKFILSILEWIFSEWWNWLLAIGMSPRFLPSSHSKAWPLLSSMPWWRWGPSPRRPCVGQRLSKHLVIIMLTYGPWIQKWPILGAGGVQMHVMPMSGKCQNYLVNLHFY